MKIAYFDCIAGASGDMILGALLHAGLSENLLREGLAKLSISGEFDLQIRQVKKSGFAATKVDVLVKDPVPSRQLPELLTIIDQSALTEEIKTRAIGIIRRLGEVEARLHQSTIDAIHLHELGGVDTLVDIVGVLIALDRMKVDQIVTSPLPLGRGFVRSAHGEIPLPAPATVELLKGVPVVGLEMGMELVTPTGAVLLTSISDSYGPIPAMTLMQAGYGAGGRDLPIPNLLRVFVGEVETGTDSVPEMLVELQTNIDDMNPEFYEHMMLRLFNAGALDVWLETIQMKKNRPGIQVGVLCKSVDAQALRSILFRETSTLGVRQRQVARFSLPRHSRTIETPYGMVRVKIARLEDGTFKGYPEVEDCLRLAREQDVPLRDVYRAAYSAQDIFELHDLEGD